MPEGASIERTDAALKKVAAIAKGIEGVESEIAFPGLNPLQFTNTPEQRRGVLHPQAVQRAQEQREGNQRRTEREDLGHPGRLRLRADAAADPGPGQWFGLFAVHRGPHQPGLRRAAERGERVPGRGVADAGHGLPDQQLPGQRAAAGRGRGPGQGQGAGRAADRTVRHAADLPGLGLRQRLQHVRPYLAGDRAGRWSVPRRRRGHRQPAHPQRQWRDGADRQHGEDQPRPTAPIR